MDLVNRSIVIFCIITNNVIYIYIYSICPVLFLDQFLLKGHCAKLDYHHMFGLAKPNVFQILPQDYNVQA